MYYVVCFSYLSVMSSHAFVVVSLVVCIFDNQALVASDLVALQTTNQLRSFPENMGPMISWIWPILPDLDDFLALRLTVGV